MLSPALIWSILTVSLSFSVKPPGRNETREALDQSNIESKLRVAKETWGKELTMHGLNRIYQGKPMERKFWIISFIAAIAFSSYILYLLCSKFLNNETVTDINIVFKNKLQLPSITLCSKDIHKTKSICYKGNYSYTRNRRNITEPCHNTTNITMWRIHICQHFGGDEIICSKSYKKILGGMCITLNPEGILYQGLPNRAGHVVYRFTHLLRKRTNNVDRSFGYPHIYIHRHDERILVNYKGHFNFLHPGKQYQFGISRQEITRLEAPYRSNCTSRKPANIDFFPGDYSIASCRETCFVVDMMRKCGAVNDLWAQYIPNDVAEKYQRNNSDLEKRLCISRFMRVDYLAAPKNCSDCPMPCKQTIFNLEQTEIHPLYPNRFTDLRLFYQDLRYMQIEETPAYSGSQLIADFGGMLGLLAGGSLLSVVEILIFLSLIAAHWYFQKSE